MTNIINLFLEKKVVTPYILNIKCAFHGKKLLSAQKKSQHGLKSHFNRFYSLISSEFKKCLIDITKTSRKRPYHQIDEEGIIALTGCSKNGVSATNNTGNAFAWTSKILTVV